MDEKNELKELSGSIEKLSNSIDNLKNNFNSRKKDECIFDLGACISIFIFFIIFIVLCLCGEFDSSKINVALGIVIAVACIVITYIICKTVQFFIQKKYNVKEYEDKKKLDNYYYNHRSIEIDKKFEELENKYKKHKNKKHKNKK